MMKAIQTENVIRNIIREIVRECAAKGIVTTDACAAYVIKLTVLNPKYAFTSDRPLERGDVEYLMQLCVEKLSEHETPSLATIKMQVHFDTNYALKEDLIRTKQETIEVKLIPMMKELLETVPRTQEEKERAYQKLVLVILIRSGLGSPYNEAVVKETTVALRSVFPIAELDWLSSLGKPECMDQILELTQIVTGIRLFNRDCHKGGAGIEDLPLFLQEAIWATTSLLTMSLDVCMEKIDVLTTVVGESMASGLLVDTGDARKISTTLPERRSIMESSSSSLEEDEEASRESVELIRDGLITTKQQEVFIRTLLVDINAISQRLKDLFACLQSLLLRIHETVRFRTAIPTIQVYPLFKELSVVWTSLQDEMTLISNISNIWWALQGLSQPMESIVDKATVMVGPTGVVTEAERISVTCDLFNIQGMNCNVIYPTFAKDFHKLPLQYCGFCGWALVEGNGALIPANRNMGMCEVDGRYYAFSSKKAARQWGHDPKRYVMAALLVAREKPELISLLELQSQVDAVKMEPLKSRVKQPEQVVTMECGMQTETHPVPEMLDKDYSSSIWEWKRRAVQLANICHCQTHSIQTIRTHMRTSIGVLARPPKVQASQTKRDKGTNVPKPSTFIYGLRGRQDHKEHVINLTFPVEKSY